MNVKKALMVSPVKEAIRDEGAGLMITVTRLEDGTYSVRVIMEGSVFLSETVPDEKAVEHVLWDHLRMLPFLFEPMQTRYPASRMQTSTQTSPYLSSPQGEHRSSLKMTRKLPRETYQLAATYQLGMPVKRHMGLGWMILSSCMPTCFFVLGVVLTVGTFTLPDMNPSAILARVIAIVAWVLWAIWVIRVVELWGPYVYECTGGFVVITRKTRQVRYVLRWNEVLNTHTDGRRWKTYFVTDIHQQTFEVPYYALWKQCEDAVAHHTQ